MRASDGRSSIWQMEVCYRKHVDNVGFFFLFLKHTDKQDRSQGPASVGGCPGSNAFLWYSTIAATENGTPVKQIKPELSGAPANAR